jgi:hypothetical protein
MLLLHGDEGKQCSRTYTHTCILIGVYVIAELCVYECTALTLSMCAMRHHDCVSLAVVDRCHYQQLSK